MSPQSGYAGGDSRCPMLFLGNSYTFYNDLDLVVGALLTEAGTPTMTTRLAEGGYTFADHVGQLESDGSAWQDAFATPQQWVVLQEQSQIPGFPETESYVVDSRAAARTLDTAAAGTGAQTLFFMTWGRRDGDDTNPDLYPDFPTMNDALAEGYRRYVEDNSEDGTQAWIAPVGLAWAAVWEATDNPEATDSDFAALYNSDGSHPSPTGTWLAACVIYSSITGESAEGLTAPPDVENADSLAATAYAVVQADTVDDFPWRGEPDTGTVDTGDPDTADTGDTDDSGTGDTSAAEDDAKDTDGACGCTAAPSPAWAALLGLLGVRRRQAIG